MTLRGLVLPVLAPEKRTYLPDWSNLNLQQPVLKPGENQGLRLDYYTDIDPDCREAVAICPRMLQPTCCFGRPTGTTHYFFDTVGDIESAEFKDINVGGKEQMLIEIRRGPGEYTVIPPSRVPRKDDPSIIDTLAWVNECEPLRFEAKRLREIVRHIATATLIVRHWPGSGRHNGLLALAGFLARAGVDAKDAQQILEEITRLAEGEVWKDCSSAVRDTYSKIAAGAKKVTGEPSLEAWIGADVVHRLRDWYGSKHSLTHPLTEAGDAECFAELNADRVRYDHRQGRFLVVDEASGIWVPDPVERLTQMTVEVMRVRQHQALALEADAKKKAIAWSIGGESRKRLTNTLALARSVPPIADPGELWDQDPFLLGVQNGVIDLRTGEWRKATPADRITMRVRVAYDPSATCPLWLTTLAGIFAPGDSPKDLLKVGESQSMIDFMQRALGYSITGDCREECCFFTWGNGRNGKGTVMNTLGWLFGDYTDDMPYSTLERSERGNGIPNDVAKLMGKRFITCSEVNEFNLNEARLKALTGRDPITARFLNHEWFTFAPVCKIWIATNNKPKIVGQDDGIWSRIHLVPFTQSFEGRENKQLKDQLKTELPGILNWIVEGTRIWLRDGLNPPAAVRAATAAYRQESNPITPFVEACCCVGANLRVQAAPAFKAYEEFCRDQNVETYQRLSNKAFYRAMGQAFKVDDSGRQTFFKGVGLIEKAPSTRGEY